MIERLYRLLLCLYPDEFRRRFGAEMLATARSLDSSGGGRRSRAALDALRTALALRADYRRERRSEFIRRRTGGESVIQDVRVAVRSLRREPSFLLFVVVTLALATGANAALFGIADRLLLRGPEHIVDPDRVARVYMTARPPGVSQLTTSTLGHVSYDILRQSTSAESTATFTVNPGTLGRGHEAREGRVGYASAGLFPLLGTQPAFGRFFLPAEDAVSGARRVAIISHGLWRRQFGGIPGVLGRPLFIDDEPFEILGVAPEGFTGPQLGPIDAWVPINLLGPNVTRDWMQSWCCQWLSIIVRLRPGVSRELASAELTTLFRSRYDGDDRSMREARLWLAGLGADGSGEEPAESRIVRWLSGVALLVLLIACANIINLLLARGARRSREISIRLALGASRMRLVRMLVIESTLLSLAGAATGLFIAHVIGGAARTTLLPFVEWPSPPVDGRVLLVSLMAAGAMGLFVGVVPALGITGGTLAQALKSGIRDGGGRRFRLRASLAVIQATLSVALLIGAGLFVRSIWNAKHLDLGFDPERVLVVDVSRSPLERVDASAREAERARRRVFHRDVLDQVRSIPGVERASVAVGLPFGNRFGLRVTVPGLERLPRTGTGGPSISAVEPAYFGTMGTRILRGRGFTPADRAGSAPVAIISEFMARTTWPNADPLGRCIEIGASPTGCTTVVGVAENTYRGALVEAPKMHVYVPLGQESGFGGAVLLVRVEDEPAVVAERVRRTLMETDSAITFVDGETLSARISPQMRSWELGMSTLMFSGLLALIVSAAGIYSLLSYLVADRRHEIGVRLALGAPAHHVARMVLRWSLGMSLAGVLLGSVLGAAAGGFVQPLLFNVPARDPLVFGSVGSVLLLVAVAAGVVPALRATRVDPLEALRTE